MHLHVSRYAKPAKKPTDPTRREKGRFPSSAFSLCTNVELKLPLRTRLVRQTHARRMHKPVEKSIASLVLWLC